MKCLSNFRILCHHYCLWASSVLIMTFVTLACEHCVVNGWKEDASAHLMQHSTFLHFLNHGNGTSRIIDFYSFLAETGVQLGELFHWAGSHGTGTRKIQNYWVNLKKNAKKIKLAFIFLKNLKSAWAVVVPDIYFLLKMHCFLPHQLWLL